MKTENSSHPLEEKGRSTKTITPCILVIFGATGDLTSRKLMPAVYNLAREGMLPANFSCVGFARRDKTHEIFRGEMKDAINKHSRVKPIDDGIWKNFENQIFYHKSEFDNDNGYDALKTFLNELDQKMGTKGNRVFYLSVQPKFFPKIIEKLKKASLVYDVNEENEHWSRVIIEKPFGRDTNSANELQEDIEKHLDEKQIFRIDHYLGKETVQNLLVFRFGNSIFESLWNHEHIDHIQITVAESIGIGTRGHFFEEEGLLRDVVQNHMMQLLSLVAMEPPKDLSANAIRDEKVKVVQSVRLLNDQDMKENVIRGQYQKGYVNGEEAVGYRGEKDVDPKSNIETYAAIKLFIDNARWSKVPIYLRAGKRMPKRATEIAITFKDAPNLLFQEKDSKTPKNVLAIRIQPDEGISMKINCKVPGPSSPIQPVKMDFRYGSYFGKSPPEAYERLIWDCIVGDSTLFARADEVESSWKIFTPILEYWSKDTPKDFPNYESGGWGPKSSNDMMEKDGRSWRLI